MSEIDLTNMFSVDGRVAVVTGASSGFGERFARVLSAAGANVIVGARRLDRLEALAADCPNVTPVQCDVASDEDCRRLIETAIDQHGQIDILVNNAGISDAPDKVEEQDPARFRSVVEVNLNAVFVLSSIAGKAMLDADGGTIINISSVHSMVSSAPNSQAGYVATKHGVNGLTKELAGQWATRGVRVNGIAPGYISTELTEEMIANERGLGWITRNTPMKRPGDIHELDGALLFLASDASSYVTGHTLVVDGGWTTR